MARFRIYLMALLSGVFLSSTGFARNKAFASIVKTETYQDIIEKAFALSLQKDRAQALTLLNNAQRIESKRNPKASRELAHAFEKIATSFFSDKAQQLFELGVSMRSTDPQLALSKMNEALKLEPENLLILWGVLRIQIQNNDCNSALAQAKKILENNPDLEETRLLISQAAVCAGQFETYLQQKALWDEKHSHLLRHWRMLELEYLFKTADFSKGLTQSLAQQKLDPVFPESFYWAWKFQFELKQAPEVQGAKYVNLCKSLSVRQAREYLPEPQLCRRSLEVETFLKKSNNTNL